ncbi:hypothetical protein HIM_00742 [Hirsutella minnesotensis 3608]|nr:hypothetical protein HIM_00742 [Hirsutella minnesotensis 3608]
MVVPALLTAACVALQLSQPVQATVTARDGPADVAAGSTWWMANITRQGFAPYAENKDSYKVFRNVADFQAKGDGKTDDTKFINEAIASGGRCGQGCNSSTTTPAIIYFPPGEYLISESIIPFYYTHLIGDARNPPTIKVSRDFKGPWSIDAAPYGANGKTWWRSRDNFFRQIRNFRIDMTEAKEDITGIHWPVAQATSLQNIEFVMNKHVEGGPAQQGIFIEEGSGGFMTDLVFTGGKYGMNVGNQQYTSRNLTFNGCHTAINMIWNWLWTFHGVSIDGCEVGINMANGDKEAGISSVGSVVLFDSKISNTKVGVATLYDPNQSETNGTLVLENVDMSSNVEVAVNMRGEAVALEGNKKIDFWSQGKSYTGASAEKVQGFGAAVNRPASLTDSNGNIVTKSKPQYLDVPASKFVSVKSRGVKGDGVTDDTKALQRLFHCIRRGEIVYFDHGAYLVTDTIDIPKNVKIVGEIWPLIVAGGNSTFQDEENPKPVFRIGKPGDVGNVEIQDLMFVTKGPQPGAIMVEFNVAGASKGSAGLFDVHFRIGGAAGSDLQIDKCVKKPDVQEVNMDCRGAFMLLHVTPSASPYLENVWAWVADHEFDGVDPAIHPDDAQITIYNGRGILIESTQGAWLWGTASEHNVLSNYQLNNADNVFMGFIQAETAYFQGNPDATVPFKFNATYTDPDFSNCPSNASESSGCARTWGMRVHKSKNVIVYGTGLYSFFDNYTQECVKANNCQDHMIAVDDSSVRFLGVSTKASVNMITLDGKPAVLDADNRNNFCGTVASFQTN